MHRNKPQRRRGRSLPVVHCLCLCVWQLLSYRRQAMTWATTFCFRNEQTLLKWCNVFALFANWLPRIEQNRKLIFIFSPVRRGIEFHFSPLFSSVKGVFGVSILVRECFGSRAASECRVSSEIYWFAFVGHFSVAKLSDDEHLCLVSQSYDERQSDAAVYSRIAFTVRAWKRRKIKENLLSTSDISFIYVHLDRLY